jgi:urease accessory protein
MTVLQKATSWLGKLDLVYSHHQGATSLTHSQNQAPLKIQRPFYSEAEDLCQSVILHTAGGVVGGDRLSINVHLQENAKALVTTAAAGKIYRSNGLQARQNIEIKIDAGACLEWLPQETIIFNEAIYRQDIKVDLAPGANFLGWEITRFGRTAKPEKFIVGDWRSHFEVWQEGIPLFIDRQWLPGNEEVFHSPHGLGGQPITGSFVWITSRGETRGEGPFAPTISPEFIKNVRQLWQGEGKIGASRLENGFLCRYSGNSSKEVRDWFMSIWQLLRISYLKRPSYLTSCVPRVWQI